MEPASAYSTVWPSIRTTWVSLFDALADYSPTAVKQQFSDGWMHRDKERPPVQAIFKVLSSEDSLKRYIEYRWSRLLYLKKHFLTGCDRTKVEKRKFFVKSDANEQLLFHGTTRGCLLGDDESYAFLCNLPNCSLCNIIRNSFDVGQSGKQAHRVPFHPQSLKW